MLKPPPYPEDRVGKIVLVKFTPRIFPTLSFHHTIFFSGGDAHYCSLLSVDVLSEHLFKDVFAKEH